MSGAVGVALLVEVRVLLVSLLGVDDKEKRTLDVGEGWLSKALLVREFAGE